MSRVEALGREVYRGVLVVFIRILGRQRGVEEKRGNMQDFNSGVAE